MEQDKIGKFIASQRKEFGMTQMEFAEKLGVTNKAVSKWETGRCLPDVALIIQKISQHKWFCIFQRLVGAILVLAGALTTYALASGAIVLPLSK